MPACWLSSSARAARVFARGLLRPLSPRILAGLALACVAFLVAPHAEARQRADSSATLRGGVTVNGLTLKAGDRVDISKRGVTITVDGDDSSSRPRRVVMVGPHISVDDDGEVVRLFSDVAVEEDERIDGDVVTVFGSSRIDGHVTGNAIAVFGSVTMGPKSVVDGDMVAIFGTVHRPEGASVGGETVDLGFAPIIPGLPALPTILLLIGMFWLCSLIGGWIVSLVMPGRLVRITATASRRMGGSLLLGLAALPLMIVTVVLLCITVIGIPVAVLLPIAFGFVMWIGMYAGLYGLGLKLLRRRLGQGSVFAGLATGTLFIAAFFAAGALLAGPPGISRTFALFLVAVGGLICLALQLIGCGSVLLSRFGTRPKTLETVEDVVVVAPAPAAASAPPLGA